MKKLFIAALALSICAAASAQSGVKHPFSDGLIIQVAGGATAAWAYKMEEVTLTDIYGKVMTDYHGDPQTKLVNTFKGRGLAPHVDLRVQKWFYDKWGHSEWGVGVRYTGPCGKMSGKKYDVQDFRVEAQWNFIQTFFYNQEPKHFEGIAIASIGAVTSSEATSMASGLCGQLGWRFDSGLGVHGELRYNSYSGKIYGLDDCGVDGVAASVGLSYRF